MYVKHIHSITRMLLQGSPEATAESHRGGRNVRKTHTFYSTDALAEGVPELPRSHLGEAGMYVKHIHSIRRMLLYCGLDLT